MMPIFFRKVCEISRHHGLWSECLPWDLSKGSLLIFILVMKKKMENSKRLGWQVWLRIKHSPSNYQFEGQNLAAIDWASKPCYCSENKAKNSCHFLVNIIEASTEKKICRNILLNVHFCKISWFYSKTKKIFRFSIIRMFTKFQYLCLKLISEIYKKEADFFL